MADLAEDEEELQQRLESAPEAGDIREHACALCGEQAEHWVPQNELDILLAQDWDDCLVPLCTECKDICTDMPEDCVVCETGAWCPEHDDLDWIKEMIQDRLVQEAEDTNDRLAD